jgi:hypothetical protein
VTRYASKSDNVGQALQVAWPDFCRAMTSFDFVDLAAVERRHERELARSRDREKALRDLAKNGPAVAAAHMQGRRCAENVFRRDLAAFDVERTGKGETEPPPFRVTCERLDAAELAFVGYTTFSHSEERPRYRLFVRLGEMVDIENRHEEDKAAGLQLARELGLAKWVDTGKLGAESLMYMPRAPLGGTPPEAFIGRGTNGAKWQLDAPPIARGRKGRPWKGVAALSGLQHELALARAREALTAWRNTVGYGTWITVGHALKNDLGDAAFELWLAWSSQWNGNDAPTCEAKWKSFAPTGKVRLASLFFHARAAGWRDLEHEHRMTSRKFGTPFRPPFRTNFNRFR